MKRKLFILVLVALSSISFGQGFFWSHSNLCNCPNGYISTNEGCYYVDTVSATPPANTNILVHKTYSSYGLTGTAIYENFESNGTGTVDTILISNWWKNLKIPVAGGPLNRTGVWSETMSSNSSVGFTRSFFVLRGKTYYVGVGCDNYTIIKLNGIEILRQNPEAIENSLVNQGIIGSSQSGQMVFKLWMIYPIYFNQGENVIEIIGNNVSSFASVGVEIYDATLIELASVTSYTDLGSKLLFSTKDEIGNPIEIGSGTTGYSCPEGYALAEENGAYYCKKIIHIGCGEEPPSANIGTEQNKINTFQNENIYYNPVDTILLLPDSTRWGN